MQSFSISSSLRRLLFVHSCATNEATPERTGGSSESTAASVSPDPDMFADPTIAYLPISITLECRPSRLASREDVPVPVAALALATTNPVVRKLIEKRILYTAKTDGQAMVTAKSFARFRQNFIGIQEVATTLGCHVARVEARAAKIGIRLKPAPSRCGFHGFSREQIDAKLRELKALVESDLRFNQLSKPEDLAA
ncbi:hypothetical protein [Bradyrhizobium sp. USDA 3458]|uniref:hypothetical protein n=1 Tax=Bradyrhizobium sp. USDA 3458 TaxID=2591461 RepID=UPI001142ECD5|nr:hypothetical protein [Bradyrhizobium sp. USDA 3458]